MPTGYTAAILEGIDFQTYAMNCARAFGACVTLRDDGGGGEKIPDQFTPNAYDKEKIEHYQQELQKIQKMTLEEANQCALVDFTQKEKARIDRLEEIRKTKRLYEDMLAQVVTWTPPSTEHIELKNFMTSQILDSITDGWQRMAK